MADVKFYENLEKSLQKQLSQVRTPSSQAPTSQEVGLNIDLLKTQNAIRALRGQEAKSTMTDYNQPQPSTSKRSDSYIGRALDVLGMPLYGVVGATEALLGKGTKQGLANIPANIAEKETFGDLLRKYNITNTAVTLPVGLALDIFFDPVNWMTAGVGATIPRIAKGLTKGAEVAKLGAQSSTLGKMVAGVGETVGKLPGLNKVEALKGLKQGAIKAGEEYNKAIGRDVYKILGEEPTIRKAVTAVGTEIRKTQTGRTFIEKLKYDASNWFKNSIREARLKKEFVSKFEKAGMDITKETSQRSLAGTLKLAKEKLDELSKNPSKILATNINNKLDEGAMLATDYSSLAKGATGLENGVRLTGEAQIEKELKEVLSKYMDEYDRFSAWAGRVPPGKTGIKIYDTIADNFSNIKVKDYALGEKIANTYKDFIFLFKSAKIGGSPSTWTNAILGNPSMALMSGLNIADPSNQYIKYMKMGYNITQGKITPEILEHIRTSDWQTLMNEAPDVVRQVWGISPGVLMNEQLIKKITQEYLEHAGELKNYDTATIERMTQQLLSKGKIPQIKQALGTPTETFRTVGEGEALTSSYISSELGTPRVMQMIDKYKDSNIAAKALNWYLTRPLEGYEKIDQASKIGTSLLLTKLGVDENTLMNFRKFIKFSENDINQIKVLSAGTPGRYRLPAAKALEIVNDMYMSYGAMPAAVKVLRTLPFMGNPFASFMYAMATKTTKTLAYNPEMFNKVQFFLKEMQGGKSPLERQALNSPYYDWLNRAGMVKLPFFQQNPVYLNLANMIPYYSMNIFETRGRNYEERLGGTVAKIFDGLPVMKTPEGQLLFDYIIQPLILRETNPVGAFNQMLYPSDATALEKIGYGARQALESVIPTAAAIPLAMITPEKFIESIPLYRARSLAYAARGKTSAGVSATEPAFQRASRVIAATYAGLSLYPVKLQYGK